MQKLAYLDSSSHFDTFRLVTDTESQTDRAIASIDQ